jgi:hypothetical protein
MKKHQVDKLFSDKLKDFEMEPSEKAWERLDAKLDRSPNRNYLSYWAAAVVILMALSGYFLLQQNSSVHTGELAVEENIQKSAPEIKPQVAERTSDFMDTKIVSEQPDQNVASKATVDNKDFLATQTNQQEKLDINADSDKSFAVQNKMASVEKEKMWNESMALVKPQEQPQSNRFSDAQVQSVAQLPAAPNTPALHNQERVKLSDEHKRVQVAEPRVIVAVIHEDEWPINKPETDIEDNRKNKRLKQIFTQLKKAKKGEEVDWDQVGFNPKSILAKVELSNNDYQE